MTSYLDKKQQKERIRNLTIALIIAFIVGAILGPALADKFATGLFYLIHAP